MNGKNSLFAILFIVVFILRSLAYGQSIFAGLGNDLMLPDHDVRIVLARVTQIVIERRRDGRQDFAPIPVHYQARVLREYEGRIAEDSVIYIDGKTAVQGSHPISIPLMDIGNQFVMVIRIAAQDGRYSYVGEERLPIGIETPYVCKDAEIDVLKAALGELGTVTRELDGRLAVDKALTLVQKENQFLWALGIAGIASGGHHSDLKRLENICDDDILTIEQLLWLDYCVGHVVPESIRPSEQDRHEMMVGYLRRLVREGKVQIAVR